MLNLLLCSRFTVLYLILLQMSMSVQALKQTNATKKQRVQTLRARTFAAALKVIAVMAETVQVKWGTGAI